MGAVDRAVFNWINGWSEWLNPFFQLMSEGNKWWPVRIGLGLLAIALMANRKTRTPTILALVAWPISNSATDVLKNTFQALRPCVELPDAVVRVEPLTSFGTASAHSANMAAVAAVMFLYFRWQAWPWMLVALLVGLSRIYVGVHYPSQVLLGWAVGALVGFVVVHTWRSFLALRARCQAESTAEAPAADS